jgi:hypothetical protein
MKSNFLTLLIALMMCAMINYAKKPIEKSTFEKINLKYVETYNEKFVKKEVGTNFVKANYNECYFNKKYSSPDSIAISYLRAKSSELGISPDLENVRIKKTRQTAGGIYIYFEQHVNYIPVFSTTGVIALNKGDTVTYVLNNFRKINKNGIKAKAGITDKDAINMATEYLNINKTIARSPKTELVFFESIDKGMELAWKVNIVAMEPLGDWFVVINANDGRIIHVEDIAEYYNGSGMVFNPNPITSAQTVYGGDYVDNYDLNNTALQNQLIQVTLRDITYENGVYRLEGPYCVLDDVETPWDNFPRLANPNDFNYTRNQQGFEAVMVYYHIDLASRRVESLGYNEPGLIAFSADPHGLNGADQSHYSTSQNYVAFGEGGVDGCGWIIRVDNIEFSPINLDLKYRKDSLKINLDYDTLTSTWNCGWRDPGYQQIQIKSINFNN